MPTKKKNWKFGLIPNGNIIAESGRYGSYLINEPINTVIIQPSLIEMPPKLSAVPVKLTLWQSFILLLKRIFRWNR